MKLGSYYSNQDLTGPHWVVTSVVDSNTVFAWYYNWGINGAEKRSSDYIKRVFPYFKSKKCCTL